MKKKFALILSAIMMFSSLNVYADRNKNIASREYVISEFVQAVGRNSFQNKEDISSFSDSKNVDEIYVTDMEIAVGNNIVKGYSDNTLRPDNPVTRAEAAVILSRLLGNVEITQSEKHFTDVPSWASDDVNKLTQGGIINGYNDTTFGSNDNITIEQVGILSSKIEQKVNKNNYKDDFFKYYNDKFARNNSLKDRQHYDNFDAVGEIVNNRIKVIIEESHYLSDDNSKRISSVYNLYKDTQSRNSLGIEPLKEGLNKIDEITSVKSIPSVEAWLYKEMGFSPLYNISIGPSPKDSSKNILQINESAVLLSKDNYFELESTSSKNAYYAYVADILSVCGLDDSESKNLAEKLYNFEKTIVQKSGITSYNSYNLVCKRNELNNNSQGLNTEEFINNLTSKGDSINIYNKEQLKQTAVTVSNENIDVLKAYYKVNLITYYAPYLSEKIANKCYSFYNSVNGGGKAYSLEDSAVDFVRKYAGVATINVYASKYYDSQKEQGIKNIINDIKSFYKVKIENNEWLSSETKKSAIEKLDKMTVKVGYYKGNKPYSSKINIVSKENGGTLMGNVLSVEKVISDYYLSLPDTQRDKADWAISPLAVNACYVLNSNEFIIPMAILEKPFYNEDGSYYENLGAIGSVVAHEISHAFDPMGASFDAYGNQVDWWTEEDKNYFYDLSDKAVTYFGKYEVANGVDNDGASTVLENISDLSGASCIVEIAANKGGDLKAVFESYAKMWSSLDTNLYLINAVKTDSHSANFIRVNAVFSCLQEFYDTYDIKQGDAMYTAPENRIKIW
ncbi:MAG: M13-type metalloendopeptidase [Lachnospirales bacterium]